MSEAFEEYTLSFEPSGTGWNNDKGSHRFMYIVARCKKTGLKAEACVQMTTHCERPDFTVHTQTVTKRG